MKQVFGVDIYAVSGLAKAVVTQPKAFYEQLEKHGGYIDPLKFIAVIGGISGLIAAFLSLFNAGHLGSLSFGIISIVVIPVVLGIGSFVAASIMFAIWKLMGSREDFETSFRCVAYSTAIIPVTIIFSVIPYIGTFIADVWWFLLMYFASTIRHKLSAKLVVIVLGTIAILFMTMNLSGERTQRQNDARQGEFNQLMNEIQVQTSEQPDS